MIRTTARSTLLHYKTIFFFFNDTATTEIYTLSLHDALPIFKVVEDEQLGGCVEGVLGVVEFGGFSVHRAGDEVGQVLRDRKSTRLNSSHANISYAVFCLKKKNTYELTSRH